MTKKPIFIGCLFILLSLNGCLDPKAVVDFTSATIETIKANIYPSLQTIESILKAYLINLQRLADKDGVTFSEDIDGLEDEVKKLESFDEKKVQALKKLGSFIAEAAASGYRRKQLMKIIPRADAAFTEIIAGLQEFVDEDYRAQLDIEKSATIRRITTVRTDFCTSEPLACELKVRQMEQIVKELDLKIATINKYKESLAKVIEAHHALSLNATKMDAAEVVKQIKEYASEAKKVSKEINSVF